MRSYLTKFKIVALIAFFSFSFISCSDDGDDDEKSFLETHGGTVWQLGEPEDVLNVYAQINSTISNPFEIWVNNALLECYIYESITDEGSPEVIENRENKVQIRIGGNGGDYGDLTLTVAGDVLRVELDSYEDGELVESDSFVLERSDENTDDLEVCAS